LAAPGGFGANRQEFGGGDGGWERMGDGGLSPGLGFSRPKSETSEDGSREARKARVFAHARRKRTESASPEPRTEDVFAGPDSLGLLYILARFHVQPVSLKGKAVLDCVLEIGRFDKKRVCSKGTGLVDVFNEIPVGQDYHGQVVQVRLRPDPCEDSKAIDQRKVQSHQHYIGKLKLTPIKVWTCTVQIINRFAAIANDAKFAPRAEFVESVLDKIEVIGRIIGH
jgi:hypothetical protein